MEDAERHKSSRREGIIAGGGSAMYTQQEK